MAMASTDSLMISEMYSSAAIQTIRCRLALSLDLRRAD